MTNFSSLFSDVMVWLSLPIFGGLCVWERNLTVSTTDRRLIQLIMLIGVTGWIWFWNSRAEQARLSQLLTPKTNFSTVADRNEEPPAISRTNRYGNEKMPDSHSAGSNTFEENEKRKNVTIDY